MKIYHSNFNNKIVCDEYITGLSSSEFSSVFKNFNKKAETFGFNNLDIFERYLLIRLLQRINKNSLKDLNYLSENVKKPVTELFHNKQNDVCFSDIAKHIILPIVEKENYEGFNNTKPFVSLPKVLLIGSYFLDEMRGGLFIAPQLGLYRIASFLKTFGVEVEVYDSRLDGMENLETVLQINHYEIIGFNILHPPIDSLTLINKVKQWSPDSLLIAGGQGAAFDAELIMKNSPIDIIALAYGEFPLIDIVMDYNSNKDVSQFKHIKGLKLRTDKLGTLNTGYIQPYTLDDLRVISLTIDFNDIPYAKYWKSVRQIYSEKHMTMMRANDYARTIRIFTETHCPMKCDFCSSTNFLDHAAGLRHKVRVLSAEDISILIKRAIYAHPNLQAIYFNDDDFLLNKQRIYKLCRIIQSDSDLSKINYICMSRVDNIEENILNEMKKAGFGVISYGIESFSDSILTNMSKKLHKNGFESMSEIAINAIETTLKAGIVPRINFILFYPTVQLKDIVKTVEIATKLIVRGAPPTYYTFVEPFPGADIMKKNFEEGYVYENFKIEKGAMFELATKILPLDANIRLLVIDTLKDHASKVNGYKKKYDFNIEGNLPASIDILILFYGLYKNANLALDHLENAIDILFNKLN